MVCVTRSTLTCASSRRDLSGPSVLCMLTGTADGGKSENQMLVLSRKVDQTIVIQGNITIKILEINGDRVKIGINAPRDVVVLRQELTEEVRRETVDLPSPDSSVDLEAD